MYDLDINKITFDYLNDNDMVIVGDPDTCRRKLKRYQEAGMTQLLAFMQIYRIPHQKVMDSIRLFGKHVIPYFK
jgi:alkanesulfonate monooxygenase SsuD/methylene tetrahydromethanopterin reductase-like flavin-dependent oxidoreductase (luciferase family)